MEPVIYFNDESREKIHKEFEFSLYLRDDYALFFIYKYDTSRCEVFNYFHREISLGQDCLNTELLGVKIHIQFDINKDLKYQDHILIHPINSEGLVCMNEVIEEPLEVVNDIYPRHRFILINDTEISHNFEKKELSERSLKLIQLCGSAEGFSKLTNSIFRDFRDLTSNCRFVTVEVMSSINKIYHFVIEKEE